MSSNPPRNDFRNNQNTDAGPTAPVANNGTCEPLLDSEDAAQLLRIHPKTLQRMARKGEVPAMQIGKLWRFRASALNDWLEKIAS